MRFLPASLALIVAALLGCGGEGAGGEVIFGLTTDMAVGFDIDRIETTATVNGAVTHTGSASYDGGELQLPAEIFIQSARDGDVTALSVKAFIDTDELPIVTREAETRTVGGRTLLLTMSLDEACTGVDCDGGRTCAGGACVDPLTLPDKLPDRDPAWLETAPDACKTPSSNGPAVVIGKGLTEFAPLSDGEALPIEPGNQGGHHVWLALRVSGLRQMGTSLTLRGNYPDLGAELPGITTLITLRKAEEGECQIYGVRFRVDRGLGVETIKGQALDFEVILKDPDGAAAQAEKRIIIAP